MKHVFSGIKIPAMVFAVHLILISGLFVELTPEPVPPKKVLQGMLVTRSQPVVIEQADLSSLPPQLIESAKPPAKEQAPVIPVTDHVDTIEHDNVQIEVERPELKPMKKNETLIKQAAELSKPKPVSKLPEKIEPAEIVESTDKKLAQSALIQNPKPIKAPTPQPVKAATEAEQDIVPPRVDATLGQNPAPPYPRISRRLKEEGTVLLEIYILANGQVGEMRIKQSSGFTRLDQAARAAVAKWRYQPATKNGQSIGFWYVQPIYFSLTET